MRHFYAAKLGIGDRCDWSGSWARTRSTAKARSSSCIAFELAEAVKPTG